LLVLTNAIYFKGTWKSVQPTTRGSEPFICLVEGEKNWPLMANDGVPTWKRRASRPPVCHMVMEVSCLFLPAKKSSLAEFASQLNTNWDTWRKQLECQD
jgi:serine protease inhibitor